MVAEKLRILDLLIITHFLIFAAKGQAVINGCLR